MSKYSAHPVLQIKKRTSKATPAQVRQDHDSLTIGAKPFISFLV